MTIFWRPSGILALKILTFQFKLSANNVTKFGAPGNRTLLKNMKKLLIIFIYFFTRRYVAQKNIHLT